MKRYDLDVEPIYATIYATLNENATGDYVRYEDAAELQRRLDAILAMLAQESILTPAAGRLHAKAKAIAEGKT